MSKSGSKSLPTLFFFSKIILDSLLFLIFHINFRMSLLEYFIHIKSVFGKGDKAIQWRMIVISPPAEKLTSVHTLHHIEKFPGNES